MTWGLHFRCAETASPVAIRADCSFKLCCCQHGGHEPNENTTRGGEEEEDDGYNR